MEVYQGELFVRERERELREFWVYMKYEKGKVWIKF